MCKKDKTQVKQTDEVFFLTCGNPMLSYEQNEIISKHVFE
jgi:hypothetical protein